MKKDTKMNEKYQGQGINFIMPMRDEKIICANNKLIDHLKVPQNKQATNTPGIP